MSRAGWPVIISADDFGRSIEINRAIQIAHERGVLSSASLMVGGEAFEDAVRRAREMPNLAVGLHLVLSDGRAVLPRSAIPHLVDESGNFLRDPGGAGLKYFLSCGAKKEISAEIEAQFTRFAETGLRMSHVDGHQHLHLHPTILRRLLPMMQKFGVRGLRIPQDDLLLALQVDRRNLIARSTRVIVLGMLARYAKWQAKRAGMITLPRTYGLAQSGRMNRKYVLHLLDRLQSPAEIYFHPTTGERTEELGPNPEELEALLDPQVRRAIDSRGYRLANFLSLQTA